MGNQSGRGALLLLATIAQLGVAIAMIFFIRRLSDVGFNTDSGEVEEMSCSLNAGTKSDPTGVLGDLEDESLCVLGYTGASVTLFAMFALTVMMCLTCNLCGVGWIVEFLVQAVLCTGWVIYSIWVHDAAKTIDGWENVPDWNTDRIQNARSTVVALSWSEAVLTGLVGLSILAIQFSFHRRSTSEVRPQKVVVVARNIGDEPAQKGTGEDAV